MDRRYNPQPQSGRNPSDKNVPPSQMRNGGNSGSSSPPMKQGGGNSNHYSSPPQGAKQGRNNGSPYSSPPQGARQGRNNGSPHAPQPRRSGLGGKCSPTARDYKEYGSIPAGNNHHNLNSHQGHDESHKHQVPPPKKEKRKNPILGFIPPTIYNPETHKILGFLSAEDLLLVALILIMLDAEDDCGEPFLIYALLYILLDFDLSDFLPL